MRAFGAMDARAWPSSSHIARPIMPNVTEMENGAAVFVIYMHKLFRSGCPERQKRARARIMSQENRVRTYSQPPP